MADVSILAGSTGQSILVDLYILATGAAETALVFNSAGLTAYYTFAGPNATSVPITLATLASVTAAWSSGGFIKIDDTGMPGTYRFDVPNAAIAVAKGREVFIVFTGFAGMATRTIKIELTGWDNQDAVRGGLSALPNANANANGGLPVLSVSGTTLGYTLSTLTTYTGNTLQTADVGARLPANVSMAGGAVYAVDNSGNRLASNTNLNTIGTAVASVQSAVNLIPTNPLTSLGTNAPSSWLNAAAFASGSLNGKGDWLVSGSYPSGFLTTSFPAGTVASTTNITAGTITTVTNLTNAPAAGDFTAAMKTSLNAATPASVTGAVGSVTAGVTVTTNNDKTGYTLASFGFTVAATLAASQPNYAPALAGTAPSWYTTPPTVGAIATAVNNDIADTIGADVVAIAAGVTSLLTSMGSSLGAHLSALITTVGVAGAGLTAIPGAPDPWTIALPGAYTSGQAGYILGHQLGGMFTGPATSILSTASLVNAASATADPYLAARLFGAAGAIDTTGSQTFYSPPNAPDGGGVAKVKFGPTNPRGGRTVQLLP